LDDIDYLWHHFILNEKIKSKKLRPPIMESWIRCYKAGVDPYDGTSHKFLNLSELEKLLAQRKDFIDIARHFMTNLYEFVAGSGFIVFLSDERGYILEVIGDPDILEKASEINLVKGYSWIEEEGGTNGIGTTLIFKKPIQVSGAEHYCEKVQGWTCSAAPIINEHGSIAGVLQMSGPSYAVHLHTLGMVVAAVEAISDQMRLKKQNRKLTVVYNSLKNIFWTMSDGAMMIDEKGAITQINPIAENMFGYKTVGTMASDVLGTFSNTQKLLVEGKDYADVELMLDTAHGRVHCLVSGKPIKNEEGQVSGAVIFFNPINKVKKLINRFSGAHATFSFEDIKGNSDKLRDAISVAHSAASSMSTVLIEGESGTGKELFAQAIHNGSSRRNGPFIALNCAAIPRELIASELFGYAEGAFTGASRGGRTGKFELASGGTLFLDEIGDMPLEQQASLLRVLQEREIVRVGGDKVISVDVRIICATNKNLRKQVEAGNVREDLYYRLNVIQIIVPPLRERTGDIPLLFHHFLDNISHKMNIDIKYVDPEVINCLQNYNWPGNVRELQNVVEKTINVINDDSIHVENLPPLIPSMTVEKINHESPVVIPKAESNGHGQQPINIKKVLADKEREEIISLLDLNGGNVTQVAKVMGVSRNTVYRKMRLYGVNKEYNFD